MKNPISWRRMGVLLAAWLCCAAALRAQDSGALEPEVKAAFLFNFVKFVEWPEGVLGPEGAPLTVCLQAGDPSAVTIEAVLRNKSVNGRPVRVQRLNRPQKSCHVVFSESGNAKRAAEIIEAVKGTPALT
ncbi:MAG: YfiR family protein [Acidobacteria bacterium]|nr:YfiR family protein [Acidobacteriota bacterium]